MQTFRSMGDNIDCSVTYSVVNNATEFGVGFEKTNSTGQLSSVFVFLNATCVLFITNALTRNLPSHDNAKAALVAKVSMKYTQATNEISASLAFEPDTEFPQKDVIVSEFGFFVSRMPMAPWILAHKSKLTPSYYES